MRVSQKTVERLVAVCEIWELVFCPFSGYEFGIIIVKVDIDQFINVDDFTCAPHEIVWGRRGVASKTASTRLIESALVHNTPKDMSRVEPVTSSNVGLVLRARSSNATSCERTSSFESPIGNAMLGTTFRFVARQRAVPFRAISSLSSNPKIVSIHHRPQPHPECTRH